MRKSTILIYNVAVILFFLFCALLLGAGLFAIAGGNPLAAYAVMFTEPLKDPFGISETLVRATPLMLVAVGVLLKITAVFAESEQALPLATTLLMQLSAGLRHFWLPLLVALVALGCGLHRFLKSEAGKRRWHCLQLRLPFVGPLKKKQAAARFARALASLVHTGVPLVDALAIVSNLSGNILIGEGIRAACGTLEKFFG